MKTDKKYSNNLKNGILTSEMLYNCIYSVNKRAKNNRDGKIIIDTANIIIAI